MMVRGEVALVVADRSVSAGLMSADLLPVIIILVIATSFLSPIVLKTFYKRDSRIDENKIKDRKFMLRKKIK